MKITQVIAVPGVSGFYYDDQRAIKGEARQNGFFYTGEACTEGYASVRTAGESISILLVLENGLIGTGDCTAVQYSGAAGRDPLFLARTYVTVIEKVIAPFLIGRDIKSFRELSADCDTLTDGGTNIHTALRYGVSQAILDAAAQVHRRTPAQQICSEYGLPVIPQALPLFGQTGDDRYTGVDKMILKGADVLPHGLINSVESKLGRTGELLKQYIAWVAERIRTFKGTSGKQGYAPVLHFDLYGTPGLIFDHDLERTAEYLSGLENDAGEFPLYIEGPLDMGSKVKQIEALGCLKELLRRRGSSVRIVADEWCNTKEDILEFAQSGSCHMVQIKTPDLGGLHNTVESILICKDHGIEAYQGGSCNETDISARLCVHTALAARADRMLAKPGMGFDEGFTIVQNEMNRTIALLKQACDGQGADYDR